MSKWNNRKNLVFLIIVNSVFGVNLHARPTEQNKANTSQTKIESTNQGTDSNQKSQIDCTENNNCLQVSFSGSKVEDIIQKAFSDKQAKILVTFPSGLYQIDDEKLEDIIIWMREISKREGQVSIEPVEIKIRGQSTALNLPLIGDILQTGYNLFSRIKNYYKFSDAKFYHAKLLYNPYNKSVMYAYFVHRKYGNICDTLYSKCDVIEYIDDDLFDTTLSKRLKQSKITGKPLKVVFHKTKAHVLEFELSLERLKKTNSSLRLYKWFIASEKTEQRPIVKKRFMTLKLAVSVIKYTLKAYDLVQAIRLYAPAMSMKTEVLYAGSGNNKEIKSVIFMPNTKP